MMNQWFRWLVVVTFWGLNDTQGHAIAMNELHTLKSSLAPTFLRCEYTVNPLGIDTEQPCLSWLYESAENNARNRGLSGYQILVADTLEALHADKGNIWDSGQVACSPNTARPFLIRYAGKPLESGQRYYWKVRVWDESQRVSAFSEPAWWEMGLLRPGDWSARWIASGDTSEREAQTKEARPMPIFRKGFELSKSIQSARVYVCGLGHYELRVNGLRVGDRMLDPGWTNYRKTCFYSTYDVTALLQPGENAVGVMLGNGMYNVPGGRYVKFTGSFGPPKLILQLDVTYTDGTRERIVSDETWQSTAGPIAFSCTYGGEDYDARREEKGWDAPGFAAREIWQAASVVEGPGGALQAQMAPPLTVMRVLKPVAITKLKSGAYLYDFGQNFSGWMHIAVQGKAGSTVKLIPAEWLKEGEPTQITSGQPSYFTYTLNGQGIEEWHPRFSYYGFRYVQVEGAVPAGHVAPDGTPVIQAMAGHYLYPQVDTIGNFTCSNILINQIHRIILEAILSNMKSVLTDCPHREKLGWLEENHLMGPSILYNYDIPALYRKIFNDIAEAQLENGLVPDIAPEFTVFQGGFRDSPSWGSAFLIAPWYVYQWYGEQRNFEAHFEAMKRYVTYLASKADGHIVSHGLGDWCDVGPAEYGPS